MIIRERTTITSKYYLAFDTNLREPVNKIFSQK